MKNPTDIFTPHMRALNSQKSVLSSLSGHSDQVWNLDGDHLGKIKSVVLDPLDGSCKRVVIAFGGFIGFGDKWFSVPLRDLIVSSSGAFFLDRMK